MIYRDEINILFGILYQPCIIDCDDDDRCGEISGISDRGNKSTQRKPTPVSLYSA
jgi:hypothetical protein